ncbi:MAG: hypothetical protein IAF38_22820 [Bacteroidia bacterium]|nr:hypothetical protein [Bacteroidia bacterium]
MNLFRCIKVFLFLLIFSALPAFLSAQKDFIEVRGARKLIYDKKMGGQRLLGGVTFVHQGVIMTCDSSHFFDNNTLEAFGNVNIHQGDTLFMHGDKLKYDGNTKMAALEGNVSCTEKDMNLTTNILTYDLNTSTASYFNGGTIRSKNNTLTSKNGYYHSPSKTMSFRYNVKLKNPDYTMECDTLQYNTVSRTAFFIGPSTIRGDSTVIKTDLGWYSTINENCKLLKNSEINTGKQILRGDSIYYEKKRGYGLVLGHVYLRDTSQTAFISGGKAEYWKEAGLSIISNKPFYTQYFEKDTLYMVADTFYAWNNVKDSTRVLRAYYNCRFFKNDMQGICDSMVFKTEDSLMVLYKSPVLWNGESQMTAKLVSIRMGNKTIYGFNLTDDAFIIEKMDSIKFNQVKGRSIEGFFVKNKLNSINVKGNAQAVYYMVQNKKIIGVNKTECSEMSIRSNEKGIDQITFKKKPTAQVLPIKDLNPEEMKLKGFKWSMEIRPKSPDDLFR